MLTDVFRTLDEGKCTWNEVEGNGGADFTFTSR